MEKFELIRRISRQTGFSPEQIILILQATIECNTLCKSEAIQHVNSVDYVKENCLYLGTNDMLSEATAIPRLSHVLSTRLMDVLPPISYNIHYPSRPLVFVHVAKAAGTSFYNFLHSHYGSADYISPHFTGDYEKIGLDDPNKLLYWGHFFFNEIFVRQPQGVYCTILRHPVDRVISHYWSWKKINVKDNIWMNKITNEEKEKLLELKDLSLEEFIESDSDIFRKQVENHQTSIFSSCSSDHPDFLLSAKNNLSLKFFFIGIVEDFERSTDLFCRMATSMRSYKLKADQENRSDVPHKPVSEGIRKKIERLNFLDMELYNHALEIYERNCRVFGI